MRLITPHRERGETDPTIHTLAVNARHQRTKAKRTQSLLQTGFASLASSRSILKNVADRPSVASGGDPQVALDDDHQRELDTLRQALAQSQQQLAQCEQQLVHTKAELASYRQQYEVSRATSMEELLEFYQLVFAKSPSGIGVFDESGRLMMANPVLGTIMGLSPDALARQSFQTMTSWKESGLLDAAYHALHTQTPQYKAAHVISSQGNELWIECAFQPIQQQGKQRLLVLCVDSTEREKACLDLAAVHRDIQKILNALPALVGYWDASRRNVYANQSYKEWFGWTQQEMKGLTFQEVLGEYYQTVESRVEAALRGEAQSFETTVAHQGRQFEAMVRYIPDIENGAIKGFVVHTADVTELKAAERKAHSASRAKSEFLATMSHEIRTPLNSVMGYSSLLLDTQLGDEQKEYVHAVRAAAESLLGFLNAILDLSKLEADQLELEQAPTDVLLAIHDALAVSAEPAQRKDIALVCITEPGTPSRILTDPGRLRQVLIQLIGNAVKFTLRGKVEVHCRAVNTPIPSVRIEVKDTGPGIPTESLSKLFQPFVQLESSMARRHGGSGMGLALCRRLVSLLGGNIGVESIVGEGSTFWLTLPVGNIASDVAPRAIRTLHPQLHTAPKITDFALGTPRTSERSQQSTSASDGRRTSPLRILVAEDNPANQRLFQLMLTKLGCRVDVAGNGNEALRAVERFSYDLIFMDCQMPELDGLSATEAIRKLPHPGRLVPIVALTANAFTSDRERCLAVGMNDFLSKPVSADALEQVILRTLRISLSASTASGSQTGADSGTQTNAQKEELAAIRAQLQELANLLDPDATIAIVKLCKEDWPKQLARAQSALSGQDAATVRRVAHYLAGSTLQIGAKKLGKRCKDLETLAQHAHLPQDLEALSALFQQVSADIFAILSAL